MMSAKTVTIVGVISSTANSSKEKRFGSGGASLFLGLTVKTKPVLILRFSLKKHENTIQ